MQAGQGLENEWEREMVSYWMGRDVSAMGTGWRAKRLGLTCGWSCCPHKNQITFIVTGSDVIVMWRAGSSAAPVLRIKTQPQKVKVTSSLISITFTWMYSVSLHEVGCLSSVSRCPLLSFSLLCNLCDCKDRNNYTCFHQYRSSKV